MTTLTRRTVIWCAISIVYCISIFFPIILYGEIPGFLYSLHHEFIFLLLIEFLGISDFLNFIPVKDEIRLLFIGLFFYTCLGAFLGLLQHNKRNNMTARGLFYAILCSMIGYTIGYWMNGHPPIFIFLNPPLFFIGGYIFGVKTFRTQTRKWQNG